MTMEEYAKTLGEMNALAGFPKDKFVEYIKATYGKDALLIKPSLYFRLFQLWRRDDYFLGGILQFDKFIECDDDFLGLGVAASVHR